MGTIEDIFAQVRKPARYIGGEHNTAARVWDDACLRFALVFPDLYEIGMSHQGLQILYHILNRQPDCLADRCYTPDTDMEESLRRQGLPLFALESRRPLADFDVIGVTLPYELCVSNILTVLDLAGVPLRAEARGEGHPLVLAGGVGSMNPEPVAPFFDAVALGDGEELILDIAATMRQSRADRLTRRETLYRLTAIDGVYVPSLQGNAVATGAPVASQPAIPAVIRRRVTPELAGVEVLGRPLVPLVKIVHDRLGIEIARGCTRGCRFCQAGMLYRPVRERSLEEILQLAERGIGAGGFEELALLSLSSGDYSCLAPLVQRLMDRFAPERVSVSMPSMRVGTLTPELMRQILRVRKTGFTLAPEAGSERLRRSINKGISEDDLLAACRDAFALGWRLLKLYFMIGLPGETPDDIAAIGALVRRVLHECRPRGGRVQLNVSVSTFVPKPHTPFQWEAQLDMEQARERIDMLRSLLPPRGVQFKWHDPRLSFLEGVLARGDRRLADLIESAWRHGARLDGWGDHCNLDHWRRAAEELGIDLAAYLRERDLAAPLPWDHLDPGVERDFLRTERERARELIYTPDCRVHGCQGCGLCDFDRIRPLVQDVGAYAAASAPGTADAVIHDVAPVAEPTPEPPTSTPPPTVRYFYRVRYSRLGDIRHLAHLELLQHLFRALRRAGWPLRYSRGFNPSPRVSFAPALPVGIESEEEYFDVELEQTLPDPVQAGQDLQAELAPGLEILEVAEPPVDAAAALEVRYRIMPPTPPDESIMHRIAGFFATAEWLAERNRGKGRREVDLRPLVLEVRLEEGGLLVRFLADPGRPGISPLDFLTHVAGYDEVTARSCRVRKLRPGG